MCDSSCEIKRIRLLIHAQVSSHGLEKGQSCLSPCHTQYALTQEFPRQDNKTIAASHLLPLRHMSKKTLWPFKLYFLGGEES